MSTVLAASELSFLLTPYDLKRLESYANNTLDYHVILDLLPTTSALYFGKRLGDVHLSVVQASILLGMGLQRKSVEEIEVSASDFLFCFWLGIDHDILSLERTVPPGFAGSSTFRQTYPENLQEIDGYSKRSYRR